MRAKNMWSITQSIRLPSICSLCHQFHKSTLAVCGECINLLNPITNPCKHCAYPLADSLYPVCGACIKNPPYFDNAFVGYVFDEPLRGLIHQFKYHNGLYLGTFLSHLMRQTLMNHPMKPDCLIPVPMHPKRLKKRGFNQAAVLTQLLGKSMSLFYDLTVCTKIKNTKPQAHLDGDERQKNLHQAFHAPALPYKHVVLIDDLMTTGNTANELARVLKQSGVLQVDVWCCARAV